MPSAGPGGLLPPCLPPACLLPAWSCTACLALCGLASQHAAVSGLSLLMIPFPFHLAAAIDQPTSTVHPRAAKPPPAQRRPSPVARRIVAVGFRRDAHPAARERARWAQK
ncbi:hypothetical protein IWX49DRAFT_551359 [Phyllosticta citricarpa]